MTEILCPACDAPIPRPDSVTGFQCPKCEVDIMLVGAATPRAHWARCPSCNRRTLRLRSKTADYRCQACGTAFEAKALTEDACRRRNAAEDATRRQPLHRLKSRRSAEDTLLIVHTLPPEIAADVLLSDLGPSEVPLLLSQYGQAVKRLVSEGMLGQPGHPADVRRLRQTMPDGFCDKLEDVAPPKTVRDRDGSEQAFEDLPGDVQDAVLREHQAIALAQSFATRVVLSDSLEKMGYVPKPIAEPLAHFLLAKPSTEDGAVDSAPEEEALRRCTMEFLPCLAAVARRLGPSEPKAAMKGLPKVASGGQDAASSASAAKSAGKGIGWILGLLGGISALLVGELILGMPNVLAGLAAVIVAVILNALHTRLTRGRSVAESTAPVVAADSAPVAEAAEVVPRFTTPKSLEETFLQYGFLRAVKDPRVRDAIEATLLEHGTAQEHEAWARVKGEVVRLAGPNAAGWRAVR